MGKRFSLIWYLLCSGLYPIYSQNTSSLPSIIIQFESAQGLNNFKESGYYWVSNITPLFIPYHLYLVDINTDTLELEKAFHILSNIDYIANVQMNRKMEKRAFIPNDEWYSNQYYMDRIDMPKVWSRGNRGINTRGDSLVVAVIDDGFYTNHPDFVGKLWVNKQEVPGDSIDHDGNGYAGDYYGWNTYLGNDSIYDPVEKAFHAMPIMGIIGANTHNTIGISGMLWYNPLMVVVGGGHEANALMSFGYILTQKKRWLTSNGKEGANVVAVNSSWGIPGAFPASAPLWCAFYDSLGKYGIMSIASVDNNNIDVAIRGDLPTLCPSPYLIAVTGINEIDTDIRGAFGQRHVHLAAPSTRIFSTESPDKVSTLYSFGVSNSGTSYATPQVTATIALMMEHACDSFTQLYQSKPDSALLILKKCLIRGVDSIASLQGITLSGGRLNVHRSIKNMDLWCLGLWNDSIYQDPKDTFPPNTPPSSSEFTLFPNPGSNQFAISGRLKEVHHLKIFDMSSRLIFETPLQSQTSQAIIEISNPPPSGVYMVVGYSEKNHKLFTIKYIKL
jgi:hypothetical protein